MPPGTGSAILLVTSFAAAAVVLAISILYLSHFFLSILQSTAAGDEELARADGVITDWIFEPLHLIAIAGVWLAPAILFGVLVGGLIGGKIAVAIGFPIGLAMFGSLGVLSSLSTDGGWMPVNPEMFARIAKRPRRLVEFYGLAFVVMAIAGGAMLLAFVPTWLWYAAPPLAGIVLGWCWLTMARLIGRLAFILSFADGSGRRRRRRRPTAPAAPEFEVVPEGEFESAPIVDPDAEESETNPRPYQAVRAPLAVPVAPAELVRPQESEMRLIQKRDRRREPKRAWTRGIFGYVLEAEGMKAWLSCGAWLGLLLTLIRFMLSMSQFDQ